MSKSQNIQKSNIIDSSPKIASPSYVSLGELFHRAAKQDEFFGGPVDHRYLEPVSSQQVEQFGYVFSFGF